MNQQQPNQNPNGYYDPQTGAFVTFAAQKKKKSLTWLYILIVAALALMITKCAADYAKENGLVDEPEQTAAEPAENGAEVSEPEEPAAAPEAEPQDPESPGQNAKKQEKAAAPEKTPEEIRDEYIASCQSAAYDEIMRRPEEYNGKPVTITGTVVQVMETTHLFTASSIDLRLRDSDGETWIISWTKGEVETPNGNVLEDDELTVYGKCLGTTSYKSILGKQITVPRISAQYLIEATP